MKNKDLIIKLNIQRHNLIFKLCNDLLPDDRKLIIDEIDILEKAIEKLRNDE
jgi:hypothetical protein